MKMKKRVILLLFVIIGILLTPFKSVDAHSVDLDPESLILMPTFIYGGNGTISIVSTVKDYTLYFQAVKIEKSTFSQMQTIKDNGDKELDVLKKDCNSLSTEMNNLKEIYNTATNNYTNGLKNTSLSEEEKEELKTTYETAKTNYQNKLREYNKKVDEYNDKLHTINEKIKELTPMYVEGNWTQITDNEISVDTNNFSGEQPYVIWAKLVTSSGTYYDESIYTMNGSKVDDTKTSSTSSDKTTTPTTENKVENKKEETPKIDDTAAKGTLPKTGSLSFIIVSAIILTSILGIVFFKKVKYMNF